MPRPIRAVLDSNVFSASHFPALAESRFRVLCRRGRVVPVYSGEMIEETVRAYTSEAARGDLLEKWLPLILDTASVLCEDLPSIWHKELVQGRGRKACETMGTTQRNNVVNALRALPHDGSSPDVQHALRSWRDGDTKRKARRENSKEMRVEVTQAARERGVKIGPGQRLLQSEHDRLLDVFGQSMIERFVVSGGRALEVFQRWRANKTEYPYFTRFVENIVYQEVLFVSNHAMKLDVNAQIDLDILTHLIRADIVVTNETGFMRQAFNDIWRPQGKRIFTSPEFAAYLERLE